MNTSTQYNECVPLAAPSGAGVARPQRPPVISCPSVAIRSAGHPAVFPPFSQAFHEASMAALAVLPNLPRHAFAPGLRHLQQHVARQCDALHTAAAPFVADSPSLSREARVSRLLSLADCANALAATLADLAPHLPRSRFYRIVGHLAFIAPTIAIIVNTALSYEKDRHSTEKVIGYLDNVDLGVLATAVVSLLCYGVLKITTGCDHRAVFARAILALRNVALASMSELQRTGH